MERCPICRGRVSDTFECQRCGADLNVVCEARGEAETFIRRAIICITREELAQAEHWLTASLNLEHSVFGRRLLGFVRRLSD